MLTPEQVWLDRRDKLNLTELKACGDAMARKIQENTASLLAAADYINTLEQMLNSSGQRIAELEKDAARYRWIDPNDRTQKQYLPWIGEAVLFCYGGVTYYGQHTGGSFQTGRGVTARNFNTWECRWMYPPAAMQPTWPEDTSDYGSRIAIVGQNGNDGLAYQEEQP